MLAIVGSQSCKVMAMMRRISEEQASEMLASMGYRLIGRDPYHGNRWHVARWISNSSITVGWADTLRGAIELAREDICEDICDE